MFVHLFVYGSLKRGMRHHSELAGARFIRTAHTGPAFRMVRLGEYPALVRVARPAPSTSGVQGELYEVLEGGLPALDEFEECPTVYQRQRIQLADGFTAFAYLLPESRAEGLEEIAEGIWLETV